MSRNIFITRVFGRSAAGVAVFLAASSVACVAQSAGPNDQDGLHQAWEQHRRVLGRPCTDDRNTAFRFAGRGTVLPCERGFLCRIDSGLRTGETHVIQGPIAAFWREHTQLAGLATGEEFRLDSDGRYGQAFERGLIVWSAYQNRLIFQPYFSK